MRYTDVASQSCLMVVTVREGVSKGEMFLEVQDLLHSQSFNQLAEDIIAYPKHADYLGGP